MCKCALKPILGSLERKFVEKGNPDTQISMGVLQLFIITNEVINQETIHIHMIIQKTDTDWPISVTLPPTGASTSKAINADVSVQ